MGGSGSTGIWFNIGLPGLDLDRVRWYNKLMQKIPADEAARQDILDELVRRSQELADLHMRCVDQNPGARVDKPHDAAQVENLLQALARFYLAKGDAIATVAAYVSGIFDAELDGDF